MIFTQMGVQNGNCSARKKEFTHYQELPGHQPVGVPPPTDATTGRLLLGLSKRRKVGGAKAYVSYSRQLA